MPEWWTSLPLHLPRALLSIGSFEITWYALLYVIGAVAASFFFFRIARNQAIFGHTEKAFDLLLSLLWGALVGARLGYVFLYGGSEYFYEPWRIISPYDFALGEWTGIRGLSFHGGLLGGVFALSRFARDGGKSIFLYSDVLVRAIPVALFFGRIGNFLNNELFGRTTGVAWAVAFPGKEGLRHPSSLYEAIGEGLLLFLLLWVLARKQRAAGILTAAFFLGYGIIRFFLEYFREPDQELGLFFGFLTMGQLLSLFMILVGLLVFHRSRKNMIY